MTNPKIEKVKTNISKTIAIIEEYQAKLKELERLKTQLENDEIVALFRREKLNEDEFAALLRLQKKEKSVNPLGNSASPRKEERADDIDEH